jgi:nucleoside-diphosphate-sugar epimerase
MEGAEGTDSPGGAPDTFLPSGAPARFGLDGGVDTIREEVGYRPEYTNRAAIMEYIDWLRGHPE